MFILNPNEPTPKELIGLADSAPLEWKCALCQEEHYEKEKRNYTRRQNKCACQIREQKAQEINKNLLPIGYKFLYDTPNSYALTKTKTISTTSDMILVECLNCHKVSYEYYFNIKKGHKKCNCNQDKKFTRDISTDEFIDKWKPLNKINFTLLDNKYINRNTQYRVRCNKCGKEDTRWGITLIDTTTQCRYCSALSIGEQIVASELDKLKIEYIREYRVDINNHTHRFDFYIPKYNTFIEYNGKQHYETVEYFGGQEQFEERQKRDNEKQEYCLKHNIQLKIFKYTEKEEEIRKELNVMFND